MKEPEIGDNETEIAGLTSLVNMNSDMLPGLDSRVDMNSDLLVSIDT